MWWPPSSPQTDAHRPLAWIRRTSAAAHANSNASGERSHSLCTTSICSSVFCTAAAPHMSVGMYTDQNCAPSPPRRMRGMSVCRHWWRIFG